MKKDCVSCAKKYPNTSFRFLPATVPLSMLIDHCRGHTKTIKDLSETGLLCDDCVNEILLDSQWSIGWKKRSKFIFEKIANAYCGETNKSKKKALRTIYSYGITALYGMCVKCSGLNEVPELIEKEIPDSIKKLNHKFLNLFVPESAHHHFSNLFCKKCISNLE